MTYSDGEVFSPGYNSDGWLTSATTVPFGGSQVHLLTNIGYSGTGGAAMHPTSASVGNGTYTYSASYDSDLRLSSVSESLASGGATLFSSTRTYDAVGNVSTVATTLAAGTGGTDNQQFCYDEQNRLTWAGTKGFQPCTGQQITPPGNAITSAQYSQSYSYDVDGRLTDGPLGAYTYGTGMQSSMPAPLHAASYIGQPVNGEGSPPGVPSGPSGPSRTGQTGHVQPAIGNPCLGLCAAPPYSATYDAAGDMTCRSTSTTPSLSCYGGNTGGAQLSYDNEQRLIGWQSAPSSPTTTDAFLYDGADNRVEQQVTQNGGPRYADWRSVAIATLMGAVGGAAVSGVDDPSLKWAFAVAIYGTGMDLGFQWGAHVIAPESQAVPSSSYGAERRGDRYLS